MFGWSETVDGFGCWETPALAARRVEVIELQRRLHVEELAITRVLDERGKVDDGLAAADGVNLRDLRTKVDTARAFDSLPEIAAAAGEGRLSVEQTHEAVRVADAGSDREWSERAQRMSPADLAREARKQRTPGVDDTRRRHEARYLRTWWTSDRGMLESRFASPDLQGAAFESVIQQITEKLTPAKGQPWERPDRRAADALTALVDRANGAVGSVADGVRPKVRRAVVQRDGKCRWPGCEIRWGLEVHHLTPRRQGGSDAFTNLAAVCAMHHRRLVPHGTWTLAGNPDRRPHPHPHPPLCG